MSSYKKILFGTDYPEKEMVEYALNRAWQTRNFEIELYWKRALYFWGFIASIFAAYAAVVFEGESEFIAVLLSLIGVVFSYAFFLVNLGSKFWQENWEAHIDMLEGEMGSQLYKMVMEKPKKKTCCIQSCILSSQSYSVSKINSFLSLFLTGFWAILLLNHAKIFNFLTFDYSVLVLQIGIPLMLLGLLLLMHLGLKSDSKDEAIRYKYNLRKIQQLIQKNGE